MIIVKLKGILREIEIFISSVRMTLQLILSGYILVYIFDSPSPLYTVLILIAMEVFAIFNIIKRTKTKISTNLKKSLHSP
jgi:putative ABC transport system permease protein